MAHYKRDGQKTVAKVVPENPQTGQATQPKLQETPGCENPSNVDLNNNCIAPS